MQRITGSDGVTDLDLGSVKYESRLLFFSFCFS